MRDEDQGISKSAKLLMLLFGVFCVSGIQSCQEIRYRWSGKEARATVSSIVEQHGRYGDTSYGIWYDFVNEHTRKRVSGYTPVSVAEAQGYFPGQTVEVEYVGGEMFNSRLKGTSNRFWIGLFVLSLVASIGCAVVMAMRSARESGRSHRGRRR